MPSKSNQQNDPEEIVISGISGAFPNSENVEEFKKNLFEGADLISPVDRVGKEGSCGLLKVINRFDHTFFGLTYEQAKCSTLPARMLLEKTLEAILDSGYNPSQLRGKNIAVACSIWDPTFRGDPVWANYEHLENYATQINKCQFIVPNRISYWFDFRGPSFPMNTACSSSAYALDIAIQYISEGKCEGAIVCASNFCFPDLDLFYTPDLLTQKIACAPFDADASGYVKSESVVAVFLQKRKHARRIYAGIVASKITFDGFKKEGIFHPSIEQQKNLYEQFYRETKVKPQDILYVEAHGTGTKVGDVVEGTSIDEFFCKNRDKPLKIGSVKSNMGHGESAATLCSIIKMIISFECGTIPANLNYKNPNPNIQGLHNGHLEVVTKPTPLEGKYFAINSYGIGGANSHLLLTPHDKVKNLDSVVTSTIPYLVTASGRTEEGVESILSNVEKNSEDVEYIKLMHEIFSQHVSGHLHRGYVILNRESDNTKSNKFFSGEKRPIWFVFSGMGSQWPTMGKSLMSIPIFEQSIRKSHQLLVPKGLNLIEIITRDDPKIFENILHSFVGITAIQVALVDTLFTLGMSPDGIIGHSVGELCCAYADGCLSAEQTILLAYYRGLVSVQTELAQGTMAAVGQGYEDIKNIIPPEIDVACHNSSTNCTLSGTTEIVQNFMQVLKQKGIFVREVNTSNIAYHSRYITALGPKLISKIKSIILEPKLRSEKWICTSAPEDEWNSDAVNYSSAEYHTNNLLNPVYFEEGCRHIPSNAIVIEIAPHGLLNAILKRSLPDTVDNITLTLKNHENNVEYFLNALGKIYEVGCELKLDVIYPPIEYPVSKSTPMISSLVKWQHNEPWLLTNIAEDLFRSTERNHLINPSKKEAFVHDHIIDGKNFYPGFGYLWLVLETVAAIRKTKVTKLVVVFENVHFMRAVMVTKKDVKRFHVSVQSKSNHFEVLENHIVVASGNIRVLEDVNEEMINVACFENVDSNSDILPMKKKDFYKELRLRGYHYKEAFRRIEQVNCDGTYAEISWNDNFVTFMDAVAQVTLLQLDCRDLILPTFIRKLVIDFPKHFEILSTLDENKPNFTAVYDHHNNVMSCGAIQITGAKGNEIARQRDQADPVREKYQFVPYISEEILQMELAINLCVRIALQNWLTIKVKTYELLDEESYHSETSIISATVLDILKNLPLIEADINIITKIEIKEPPEEIKISTDELPTDGSVSLIILSNIQDKTDKIESIFGAMNDISFIIAKQSTAEEEIIRNLGLQICFSRYINQSEKIFLLTKTTTAETDTTPAAIKIKNNSYTWIPEVQKSLLSIQSDPGQKLILYAEQEPFSGILGFFHCLRREYKQNFIRCFYILDEDAPEFTLGESFYKSQIEKNLSQNVYKEGHWGSYCNLPLEPIEDTESAHAFCTLEDRGDLSSFRWMEGSLNPITYRNTDEASLVHVNYSSLNFHDVMLAVRRISAIGLPCYSRLLESQQGIEFSGRGMDGKRLMGIVRYKGIATVVETSPSLTWKVPDSMSLEEAATIPIVYSTVIYAFFFCINLKKGSTVLIHAGSGGIGQAAINICLQYKCTIFTTVGTPEKREFIKKTFPQIPESHIGNSRNTTFEEMIKVQTKGRGVDVVLNSLSEEKLRASVRCVAKGGHFLEIGKFDIFMNNSLELGHFLQNITFHSVQLEFIFWNEDEVTSELHKKLQEFIDQGVIKPLPRTVFGIEEVESAFRYIAAGKHIGKVIIKIRNEINEAKPTSILVKAKPRVLCPENKSFVIIGGLGGFGMELADWLILRGARNIILSSRTGVKNGYQSYRIKIWRSYGVKVIISTDDVTKETGVRDLLQNANLVAPVAGIFNLALILKDDPFLKQSEETFTLTVSPKAIATMHLDKLSRAMCPHLEHFVVFSSVISAIGNPDQTSYGFANSIMERICETRQADGLPALAIQWGAIGEVGVVADMADNNMSMVICGSLQQRVKSCLETLNTFMKQRNPVVTSLVVAEKRRTGTDIIETVANILGIKNIKTINKTWKLPEFGMDSILGLEVKQVLESEFEVVFTPEDLQNMTFAELYRLKEEKKNGKNKEGKEKETIQLVLEDILKYPMRLLPLQHDQVIDVHGKANPLVFIFPGIEGTAVAMQELVKNLNIQAWCFQYHYEDSIGKSFQEMCEYFAELCLEKVDVDEVVHVVAHSYGGLFAMEVVRILEKKGQKCCTWFIESYLWYNKTTAIGKFSQLQFSNEKCRQDEVCRSVIQILQPKMAEKQYLSHIEKSETWEAKKKLCLSFFSVHPSASENGNKLLDRIYNMAKQIPSVEISHIKLKSHGVLIRCAEDLYDTDESYGLSQYFENPIKTHRIEGVDHHSIVNDPRTAQIIMECWM